jgi:hypothetical protein
MCSNANAKCKCQGDPSLHKKPFLKRQHSTGMVQDSSNERPLKRAKRRCVAPREDSDNNNMRWVLHEIAGIKETLEEIAFEVREDRQHLISTLEELDFACIKESLDEITYNAKEESDNLHTMLADILAEVQEREK